MGLGAPPTRPPCGVCARPTGPGPCGTWRRLGCPTTPTLPCPGSRNAHACPRSTKDITQEEFDRWNRHCEKGGARKILKRDANLAAAQIQAALKCAAAGRGAGQGGAGRRGLDGAVASAGRAGDRQGLMGRGRPSARPSIPPARVRAAPHTCPHLRPPGSRHILYALHPVQKTPILLPRSYKFTKEDIQRKLAAKREKGQVVGGLVTEKERLRGLLEAAEIAGDVEEAAQ